MAEIYREQLANGLWLLAEPIASAQSLAMSMMVPAGVSQEPDAGQGAAAVLAEMMMRGAGDLDARGHSEALDRLGVQRGTSVTTHHIHLHASMIGSKLPDALPLLADMVTRPMLAATAMEPSRDLAIQSIDALDDEPQQKVMLQLKARQFPAPFGRSSLGVREHLEAMSHDDVKAYWGRTFVPGGAVLGFAGRFDWSALRDHVAGAFASWRGRLDDAVETAPAPRGYTHETAQTQQVHIGVAYDAPPEPAPESMLQRAVTAVLSGGMSGRLFTEVREKRGLCYAVYASYSAGRDRGAMLAYSGTTTPRAQETLDVLTTELRRVCDGIDRDEFDRAIIGMKSRLVMQGESTGARAAAIANDQYVLGRPRTLDELASQVDAVTLDAVNDHARSNRPGAMTLVTVGPEPLRVQG
jgi:predicted Zn-dependent peptidase